MKDQRPARNGHTARLNAQQQKWLRLYLGRGPLAGNATACYMAVYNCNNRRTAGVCASRLLAKPHVKDRIEAAEAKAIEQLAVDAQLVLRESVTLLNRSMGYEPVQTVQIDSDPESDCERVSVRERYEYDPGIAHKALQLIGQHKDVQAFTQTVEHTHTHRLEQALAKRSKEVEARALARQNDDPAGLPAPGEVAQRGSINEEVIEDAQFTEIDPTSERAGATPD